MARLILVILLVMAVLGAAMLLGRVARIARHSSQEANLPDTVKTMSYVLLILLMFGVVTGWLGGL